MAEGHVIRFNETGAQAFFEIGLSKVYHNETKVLQKSYTEWLEEKPRTDATHWKDTELGHSGLGQMQVKNIGEDFQRDRLFYGAEKSYTMQTYGLALVIQHEVLEWDLFGVFLPITKQLAKTSYTIYDIVAYAILMNAFSTSNATYTDYRGEALCSTSHARMDGGTWKNRPSSDAGLSMTTLQTAFEDLPRTVNDRGLYAPDDAYNPRWLVTSRENLWLARTLLNSQYDPNNANQQYNNLRPYDLKERVSNYITVSTYWFLLCGKEKLKVRLQLGENPDLVTDTEPGTRNMLFSTYCSFRPEVYEGRGIYGSTGV